MVPANGTRLDSWKAIAEYLGRNTRTVTRWTENRGMPVHRMPGGKRNAVFAYTSEIDAWLTSRSDFPSDTLEPSDALEELETDQSPLNCEVEVKASRFTDHPYLRATAFAKTRWALLAATISVIGLVWGIQVWVSRSHALASVRTGGFIQLTDDGRNKRNLRTDGATLYFNESLGIREVLMSTTTHGGPIRQVPTPFSNVNLQDVSHNGQKLLITSFEGIEVEQPLWVISSQGGTPQRVGNLSCHSARWSPGDTKIACATGQKIILFDVDGANPRLLGSFPSSPMTLEWSPDGTRLRFVLKEPGSSRMSGWELDVRQDSSAGTDESHKLSLVGDCCSAWGWTQDGKSFVFVTRYQSDKPSLFVRSQADWMSEPIGTRTEIPVGIGRVEALALGRAGSETYLLITGTWRGELFKLDPKRNSLETFLNGMSANYISFSRDGQWISYVHSMDGSLWRSRVDGTDALRLTRLSMDVELPSWSPDGTQIAFTAMIPGKPWRIFLVNKDGTGLREAAVGNDDQGAPTWSPDGKSLVYANIDCQDVQICGVHRFSLDSGRVEMVQGSGGFRTARWSPDGSYIAALQPERHELMLYNVSTTRWKALAGLVTGDDISWSKDSQYVYVDSPQAKKPIIERVRISDGSRTTVGDLSILQTMPGVANMWFGLTPDDSLIVLHFFNGGEVYALTDAGR